MAIYTVTLQNVSGDQVVSLSDGSNLAKLQVNPSRGPQGAGWTGVTYNTSTGRFTFTSNDGLGYVSDDITVGLDAAVAAAQAAQAGAEAAEAATELLFDQFGDQYLGPKASDPTLDNDGNPLVEGAVYFNTTDDVLKFYSGTAWVAPELIATNAATAAQASATAAATSETNAAASESAAATSATNAAASETAAATSETNAATSETNAAASASAASTSETNAAASASAASTSETNAAASASAASTSETNAAASASSASTSASNAATSESNAAASASAASTSASNAATSESNAATSAASAAASFDQFDDRYLGAKASDPTVDNDGDPLVTGALYFNTTTDLMKVYNGSSWVDAGSAVNGTAERNVYTATGGQTTFSATYDVGYVDVYLNGVKLVSGTDFTATNGTSIVLASGATAGDTVDIIAYGAFSLANHYTKTEADSRFVNVTGDTMTGNLDVTGTVTADGLTSETSDGIPLTINGGANASFVQFTGGTSDDFRFGTVNSKGTLSVTNSTDNRYVLDIGNNGDISFYEDTGTTPKLFWDASDERLYIGDGTYSNDGFFLSGFSGGYQIFNTKASDIRIATNNSEVMRITSSGFVGIGTSSPQRNLQVGEYGTGSSTIAIASATNGYGYLVFGDSVAGNGIYRGAITYDHTNDAMLLNTAATERARIDASGNLLVGKTSSSANTTGAELQKGSGGQSALIATADGTKVGIINRTTSDGDLLEFRKDGTTVGSIGVWNGDNISLYGNSSHAGLGAATNSIEPIRNNAPVDNSVDLGVGTARWRNLYLSGGVYLGGTGAANYLDDYEEGTWTPTLYGHTTAGTTSGTLTGKYTKIGRKVFATVQFAAVSLSSATGRLYMGGLPFTSLSGAPGGGLVTYIEGFNPAYLYTAEGDSSTLSVDVVSSGTYLRFRPSVTQSWDNYVSAANSTWNNGGGSTYGFLQFTYMTT